MKCKVFVSLIAYAHNDQDRIAGFLKKHDEFLSGAFESYEIIIVNDGSTDRTSEMIEAAAKSLRGTLILINLPWKHGVEPAMTAGLHKSVGDFVYEKDSIESDYETGFLMELYETAVTGYDIVAGVPGSQSITSRLFYRFISSVSYAALNMTSETVRLSSRRAINAMLALKEKFRYRKALYMLTGYPRKNLFYQSSKRGAGRSRFRGESLNLFVDVVIGYSNIGIKLIHFLSAALFLFSLGIGGWALFSYFNENVVEGWTTIMVFLSCVFSGLFFILGIIGEYVLRILDEVKGRPYYTASSIRVFSETANTAKAVHGAGPEKKAPGPAIPG